MSLFDTAEPVIDPAKNYIEELVGEGKKYKTVEDLARSVVFKDAHITKVESETAQLRQELAARPTADRMQEILDRLDNLNKPAAQVEDPAPQAQKRVETTGLTAEDVEQLLDRRTQAQRKADNLNKVRSVLTEKLGPGYASHIEQVARDMNVPKEFLEDAAKTSPEAFLKLVGIQDTAPVRTGLPPPSSATFAPQTTERTQKYYQKLRQENPSKYHSRETQNQEMQDALRLGDRFFDI